MQHKNGQRERFGVGFFTGYEQGVKITKFDEEIFRRLIEKVKVQSMVEVVFVFKTGEEVREIF
jgi:hypothetical protein